MRERAEGIARAARVLGSAGAVFPLLALLLLSGCSKARDIYLDSLVGMESTPIKGEPVSDKTVAELSRKIDGFRAEVDRKVKATENLGVYWKMLAVRYMNGGMYGEAMAALREAVAVYPENPLLFYYQGMCAARLAKAQTENAAKQAEMYRTAEDAYRRAIALDPVLVHALYGLAILYIFELERPAEAEPLLKKALEVEKKNWDCWMLLARVYYETRRAEQAVGLYDTILGSGAPEAVRRDAEANRKRIQEELHGSP
jgi:cytochrome c-type biogenesis protein CcmH/NrfG